MISTALVPTNDIRTLFTAAMSAMYRTEVPQYSALQSLVKTVNKNIIKERPDSIQAIEIKHLDIERHGAIRLGTAQELSTMRRLFAVMGMLPVDYYDLSIAGIPVHSTAFRAIDVEALQKSPFRIFTSLLRLDLIQDEALREKAENILAKRDIFSDALTALIEQSEKQKGLSQHQADQFVNEALETFRWHQTATVEKEVYDELSESHRLIADVVSFKGPHINHLTPRTLDIDAVQLQLSKEGFKAKAVVEGPPLRNCPILLRQTSFIALEEAVIFMDGKAGTHTARFGEIEQRGIALTPKGRALYDLLLQQARSKEGDYQENLKNAFLEFPDSHEILRQQGLAYYKYSTGQRSLRGVGDSPSIEQLIANGNLEVMPIIYEDFLPVSAAGIFQSNLAKDNKQETQHSPNQEKFENDLGAKVIDSFSLYERIQQESIDSALNTLGVSKP